MEATQKQSNKQVLLLAMREKWNIIRLSRSLGKTIAETSRELDRYSRKHPHLKEIFESLNWPLNVNIGHIYVGSFTTEMCPDINKVREYRTQIKNLVSRGQKFSKNTERGQETRKKFYLYIKKVEKKIADLPNIVGGSVVHGERLQILKPGMHVFARPIAGKAYSEIFLAKHTTQYLIHFGFRDKKTQEFQRQKSVWLSYKDINDGKHEEYLKRYSRYVNTKKTRIKYTPGRWVGVAPSTNLISVNSNWK